MQAALGFATAALLFVAASDDRAPERERMVREQIAARGISSQAVLDSMRSVRRHMFIPEPMRMFAYGDRPVPIGYGQTISQPYVVALMTEMLDVDRRHRVLEIGTGSGYQAAVLSRLALHVYTIERNASLADRARATLASEGIRNVTVRTGDGFEGWPEQAPFDRILVTAAPEQVPPKLLEQLKPGGKLVAPVGRTSFEQELLIIEKDAQGHLTKRSGGAVRFVPMVPGTEPLSTPHSPK